MSLRPNQLTCLTNIKEKRETGVLRQLVVAPCGFGKTVCFANMPQFLNLQGRMMVEVHREELAAQAADKIQKWNPHLKVGIEMADRCASNNDDVVVASVQTLYASNFRRLNDLMGRMKFEMVVVDEAHHYAAEKFKATVTKQIEANPELLLVGFTATPNRADGMAMGQLFDEIVYQYSLRDAINDGWLVDIAGIRLRTTTDLTGVKSRAGDYAQDQLSLAVNTPQRNELLVKGWIEHALARKTVGFCVDVDHAQQLAWHFQKNSIPAEAIWAADPLRREKLAAHRRGELKVITNCGILTEGYDDWDVSCIIMARPTKSQSLFVQCVGRGTRLPEGINNLVVARQTGTFLVKTDCLVLDPADVTGKHSLVTLPTLFGLPEKMDLKGKSALAAVAVVEEEQAKHPELDFSKVESLTQLRQIAENVNLWTIKWTPEVIQNSELQWHKSSDGSFCLLLPAKESVVLYMDLLGKWNVKGSINTHAINSDNFDDLPSAFQYAEMNLSLNGKEFIKRLRRDYKASGKDEPATAAQIARLRQMRIPYKPSLTKGEAGYLMVNGFRRLNAARAARNVK
jgi:superfamily II DNA or RNA helicase